MKSHKLDAWVEGFLDYERDVKRLNHRSIADKRCSIKKVSYFMSTRRPDVPLWKLKLEDYLAYLNAQREKGQSESALAKDISHTRGLLDYAWRSGRAERNILDGFSLKDRIRRVPPKVLSMDEARNLVFAYDNRDKHTRRSRVIVLLLYGCGLRTFELCGLSVQDVNVERQELLVRHGKGDKQRSIPVPGAVWVELMAYLVERGGKGGPLFRTEIKKKRISVRDVSAIVKEAAVRAGIEWKVTPKTLRHTFGTHLMERGVDVAVIASLMGHSTANETGVYLHVMPGRKEEAVSQLLSETGGEE